MRIERLLTEEPKPVRRLRLIEGREVTVEEYFRGITPQGLVALWREALSEEGTPLDREEVAEVTRLFAEQRKSIEEKLKENCPDIDDQTLKMIVDSLLRERPQNQMAPGAREAEEMAMSLEETSR